MPFSSETMIEMFVFEATQLIEVLEQSVISGEQQSDFSETLINEIMRAMHTIKGSSAMMMYNGISTLSHALEDLFYYLREEKPTSVDYATLSDLVLEGIDFIKLEVLKIKNGDAQDGDASDLIERVRAFLQVVKDPRALTDNGSKHSYFAVLFFQDDAQMENIRAFSVTHQMKEWAEGIEFLPDDILENPDSAEGIRSSGFRLWFETDRTEEEIGVFFEQVLFLKSWELHVGEQRETQAAGCNEGTSQDHDELLTASSSQPQAQKSVQTSMISVNVVKLDKLMDLIGELVISEAMVTQNPELKDLELDHFWKAARHLRKITSEIQDMVMSIRMVPLTSTFNKMNRIVRDMCKRLDREVRLEIVGEETEVDKNIIESLSDPLMHLIRNAIDHGIEAPADRIDQGKPSAGTITLEARNAGSDVMVVVKDDGKGLSKQRILERAAANGLLVRPEHEMSEKEIFSMIFLPGFSTKESVTEFSGRGVGMDVVSRNIETVGGAVSVESTLGEGTSIYIKIPLTLAIIDGMNIRVGRSRYTIPMTAIKESFRPNQQDVITDPEGNEMIMVRGMCYPIIRLHERFKVWTEIDRIGDGILMMVETDTRTVCLFADELIGEQQVVVKAMPDYIKQFKQIEGLAGCTLLGDGNISLILDIAGIVHRDHAASAAATILGGGVRNERQYGPTVH